MTSHWNSQSELSRYIDDMRLLIFVLYEFEILALFESDLGKVLILYCDI
jgi:hypothetical protein